jgi:hypothetical protein
MHLLHRIAQLLIERVQFHADGLDIATFATFATEAPGAAHSASTCAFSAAL